MLRYLSLAIILSAGCSETPQERLAAEARKSAEDAAIITLALNDFRNTKSVWLNDDVPHKAILLVDAKSTEGAFYISADQLSADFIKPDRPVTHDIIVDLGRRNTKTVSFEGMSLGTQVVFEDLSRYRGGLESWMWSELRQRHPNAKAHISLWLPGYDKNMSRALVRFWFGPTPHGATATYLFVKEGSTWKIKAKDTALYL